MCFGSMAGSCFSKWGVGLNLIHSVLAARILCTTVLAVCILHTGNAPAKALMRGHLYCLSFLPVINLPHEFYMHRGKQVEENKSRHGLKWYRKTLLRGWKRDLGKRERTLNIVETEGPVCQCPNNVCEVIVGWMTGGDREVPAT